MLDEQRKKRYPVGRIDRKRMRKEERRAKPILAALLYAAACASQEGGTVRYGRQFPGRGDNYSEFLSLIYKSPIGREESSSDRMIHRTSMAACEKRRQSLDTFPDGIQIHPEPRIAARGKHAAILTCCEASRSRQTKRSSFCFRL